MGGVGDQGAQTGMQDEVSLSSVFSAPYSHPTQDSFLIYPESETVSFSEPQISQGIP